MVVVACSLVYTTINALVNNSFDFLRSFFYKAPMKMIVDSHIREFIWHGWLCACTVTQWEMEPRRTQLLVHFLGSMQNMTRN